MKQRYERDDSLFKQIIDEGFVEGDSGRVDGVVAASEGNDAGPGEGEAVGFCAGFFEKGDVF